MKNSPHGGSAKAVAERLGLSGPPAEVLDFSVNINPLGPPPALYKILRHADELACRYPEEYAASAGAALAEVHGVKADRVVVGNGAIEIFGWILQSLKPDKAACVAPCCGGYKEACRAHGVPLVMVKALDASGGFQLEASFEIPSDVRLLFIGSPNNLTGRKVSSKIMCELAESNPHCTVVVDASFEDFCQPVDCLSFAAEKLPANLIVVKSLTEFFCIPGLRLGMAVAGKNLIDEISAMRLPWSVNGLAQELALTIYDNEKYLLKARTVTAELRGEFRVRLQGIDDLEAFPSDANFVLVKLPDGWTSLRLQDELLKRGILIRSCGGVAGLGAGYCRFAVRPREEQARLVSAMRELLLGDKGVPDSGGQAARAVMVVGTTSNAGKSVVAAGLCRLLARQGQKVSPFKAQNMALNSYVTVEGGEMGRAQVVQAAAAGVRPHTDMNPVLLKPLGDEGSQVIVNGKAIGNFKARDFYEKKEYMRQMAHDAYDRLAAANDIIVLEGAGSPAEINLMDEDFVNMDMAAYAGADVILVADIDRGGVFATILGTINLLPEKHRRLLVGVVINKFRGDVTLLESGIKDIERMTGIPVLGVLPYLRGLKIEDEDSVGLEERLGEQDPSLDVVVVRLPHISNFTDFLAMEHDVGVGVRFVEKPSDVGQPDIVIVPGTKNTRSDLRWMHETGMAEAVCIARERGIPVMGICGGYQMLGRVVSDPCGVEGVSGTTEGLGLLPVSTELLAEKELSQVAGETCDALPFGGAGVPFVGYEIHAGVTVCDGDGLPALRILRRGSEQVDEDSGLVSEDGLVFGCYVHGVFDGVELRAALWLWLCERRGLPSDSIAVNDDDVANEYERLADMLEKQLQLERVPALTPCVAKGRRTRGMRIH